MRWTWLGPVALAAAAGSAAALDTVVVTGKAVRTDGMLAGGTTVEDTRAWEARGRPDLSRWLDALPGVQANRGQPGLSLPTVRGIGTVTSGSLLGTQQATTGLYVEDVPLTDPFGYVGTPDLTGFLPARLEVLRGPQGVLYGSSALGGVINQVLQSPTPGLSRSVGVAGVRVPQGGRPLLSSGVALNRPLAADGGAVWLEAFAEHGGGEVDNLGTGRADADRQSRVGARIATRWRVGDDGTLQAWMLQQRARADDTSAVWPDASRRATDQPTASSRRNTVGIARLEFRTELAPAVSLTAVSGFVDKQLVYASDLTRTLGTLGRTLGPAVGAGELPDLSPVVATTGRPLRSRTASHEVRLSGSAPSGLGWLAGLSTQRTDFESVSTTVAPGAANAWGPLAAILLPGDEIGSLAVSARSRETALFADASVPLAEGLRASAGARVFRATLDDDATLRYLGQTTGGRPRTAGRGATPRVALEFTGDRQRAFALLSGGYRVGGVNLDPPAFTAYRPDRVINQEVGWQLRTADGGQVDIGLYRMDWRDAQVSALLTEPVPLVGVANVGRARSQGVEATVRWPVSDRLDVGGRLALTDARTRQAFVTAAGRPVAAGAWLPGVPRVQLAFDAERAVAAPEGWRARLRLDAVAQGRRVDAIGGDTSAPARLRLDAGVEARHGPWQWRLRLENVANTTDVAGTEVIDRPGLPAVISRTLTPARTWALTMRREL